MSTLTVETQQSTIRLKSARLVVSVPQEGSDTPTKTEIRLNEIDRIVIADKVQITTQALVELLRREIAVHYVDGHGHALGSTFPAPTSESQMRLNQYRRSCDPEFCLAIGRKLIEAKIANQRRIIQKLDGNRPGRVGRPKLPVLAQMRSAASQAEDLRALRGIEGTAARRYFSLWSRFLPTDFPFEFRSARPPLNPVNACISIGSVVVYREIEATLWSRGLDPGLGCLHVTSDRRASLALDLIEPFRPALIEALPMYLFGRGILTKDDFESKNRGIYLNRSGREKFISHYESRVERRFFHRQSDERTTFRQQFIANALSFKAAIQEDNIGDSIGFEPFLLR